MLPMPAPLQLPVLFAASVSSSDNESVGSRRWTPSPYVSRATPSTRRHHTQAWLSRPFSSPPVDAALRVHRCARRVLRGVGLRCIRSDSRVLMGSTGPSAVLSTRRGRRRRRRDRQCPCIGRGAGRRIGNSIRCGPGHDLRFVDKAGGRRESQRAAGCCGGFITCRFGRSGARLGLRQVARRRRIARLSVLAHNVPEGLATAAVLRSRASRRRRCVFAALLAVVPQPLSAMAAFSFASRMAALQTVFVGFAAGLMLMIALTGCCRTRCRPPSKKNRDVSAAVACLAAVACVCGSSALSEHVRSGVSRVSSFDALSKKMIGCIFVRLVACAVRSLGEVKACALELASLAVSAMARRVAGPHAGPTAPAALAPRPWRRRVWIGLLPCVLIRRLLERTVLGLRTPHAPRCQAVCLALPQRAPEYPTRNLSTGTEQQRTAPPSSAKPLHSCPQTTLSSNFARSARCIQDGHSTCTRHTLIINRTAHAHVHIHRASPAIARRSSTYTARVPNTAAHQNLRIRRSKNHGDRSWRQRRPLRVQGRRRAPPAGAASSSPTPRTPSPTSSRTAPP